jgi:hypothetical protein
MSATPAASSPQSAPAEKPLLAGTASFVKDHLLPVNALVACSLFTVAGLDFLRPIAPPSLPIAFYSATLVAALALIAAGALPARKRGAAAAPSTGFASTAIAPLSSGGKPLRRRPWWVFSVALLALISGLGWATQAAAGQRGVLAGSSTSLASLQAALLSLRESTNAANTKLDEVLARQADPGPTAAGNGCPDIQCALGIGASEAALRRHLDRGQQLPTDPAFVSSMFQRQVIARSPSRFAAIALYLDTGALPSVDSRVVMSALSEPAEQRAMEATLAPELAGKATELYRGRRACRLPRLRLTEVAALRGDRELYEWLVARGADPRLANDWCEGASSRAPFTAEDLLRGMR